MVKTIVYSQDCRMPTTKTNIPRMHSSVPRTRNLVEEMSSLIKSILAHIHILLLHPFRAPLAVGVEVHHTASPNDLFEGNHFIQWHTEHLIREETTIWFVEGFFWPKVAMTKSNLLIPAERI